MAKILNAYVGNSASDIKSNADIPSQANMTVVGTTVECNNISILGVRSILGETVDSLQNLCNSSLVNKWSNFSPYTWSINGSGLLVQTVNSPYSLGSFAGYNHTAAAPRVFNRQTIDYAYALDSTPSVSAYIDLGEIDLLSRNLWGGNTPKVVLRVYEGETLAVQSDLHTIDADLYDGFHWLEVVIDNHNWTAGNHVFTCKIEIIDDLNNFYSYFPTVNGTDHSWTYTVTSYVGQSLTYDLIANQPSFAIPLSCDIIEISDAHYTTTTLDRTTGWLFEREFHEIYDRGWASAVGFDIMVKVFHRNDLVTPYSIGWAKTGCTTDEPYGNPYARFYQSGTWDAVVDVSGETFPHVLAYGDHVQFEFYRTSGG